MTIGLFDPLYRTMSRGHDQQSGIEGDPEFNLLVAACHSAFDPSAVDRVTASATGSLSWSRVLRLARFHRVEGLLWQALERAAVNGPQELRALALSVAARNLVMVASCGELLDCFRKAGVPLLFVKGLSLAMLAYGDIAAKSSADIDLLVDPNHIPAAAGLLEAAGFQMNSPNAPHRERIGLWHQLSKESSWTDPKSGTSVDLHSRLADNSALIPTIGVSSPTRQVEVGSGVALPTLQATDLIAYLAVHGSSSAWFRLKWIGDFAALLHREHRGRIGALYADMRTLGTGRAADQALLLADRLFGTLDGEPDLRASLLERWSSRQLGDIAWRMLQCGCDPVEPTNVRLGTAPIHYSQFLLRSDALFLAGEFARIGRTVARRLRFRS